MNKEKFYVSNGIQHWEFSSLKEIFSYKSPVKPITLQIIGHNFNDTYIDGEYGYSKPRRIKVEYVIYDYLWRVVRKETIAEALEAKRYTFNNWYYSRVLNHRNYPGFRNGPIPRTGKSGFNFYGYFRAMKTTPELRWNCAHRKFTRGKRRNLRSAWDDVPRSDNRIKQSWKKQKKRKQWM